MDQQSGARGVPGREEIQDITLRQDIPLEENRKKKEAQQQGQGDPATIFEPGYQTICQPCSEPPRATDTPRDIHSTPLSLVLQDAAMREAVCCLQASQPCGKWHSPSSRFSPRTENSRSTVSNSLSPALSIACARSKYRPGSKLSWGNT